MEEEVLFSVLLQLFCDYVDLHPTVISDPSFEEEMIDSVVELMCIDNWIEEEELYELIDIVLPFFYEELYTYRSYSHCQISFDNDNKENITKKLSYLSSIEQPQQRTPEWYAFRNTLITASNAYKIFESPAQQNSLIYEKCNISTNTNTNTNEPSPLYCHVNTESPLHWGQKYEPLSVMFYEYLYHTKVGEYGCIRHSQYSFIGASPDGINNDPSTPRYGRMLEIKNIVNREITGIPKKEYWIQMQLQMETCDLDECDFLETRFVEYENEILFLRDSDCSIFTSIRGERKGMILYFSNQVTGFPLYIYMPLELSPFEYEKWSEDMIENTLKQNPDLIWIRQIYWKLDEYSCILVKRNKKWFADVLPLIRDFWKIVEKERITGYEHRAPNKRQPKPILINHN
jgi:putative phage-type endonuclease